MKNAGAFPTPEILTKKLKGEAQPPAHSTSPPGDSHVHFIFRSITFPFLCPKFGFSWAGFSFRPPVCLLRRW